MNGLTLLDFVVIIKNYSLQLLKRNVTGNVGSSSNASDVLFSRVVISNLGRTHRLF
jgi:hypothetical protein